MGIYHKSITTRLEEVLPKNLSDIVDIYVTNFD